MSAAAIEPPTRATPASAGAESFVPAGSCSVTTADPRRAIVQNAMRWMASALDRARSARTIREVKRLSEFAVVAYVLDRPHMPALGIPRAFPRRTIVACWRALEGGEALRRFVARDPTWGILVTAYIPFCRFDLRNVQLERILRHVLATTEFRLEYAILIAAAQRLLGGVVGGSREMPGRWLARWTSGSSTIHDVYMLAHAVYYATDFGRDGNGLAPVHRRAVARSVPRLLQRFTRSGEYDILAEVALVASFLRMPVAGRVWETLRSAQRTDGSIPFSRRRRRSARDYHSTLAALMAAAAGLEAGAPGDPAGTSHTPRRSALARGPGQSL